MTMIIIYLLALLGAYRVVRWWMLFFIGVRDELRADPPASCFRQAP